jgi:hypothetical protein
LKEDCDRCLISLSDGRVSFEKLELSFDESEGLVYWFD